MWSDNIREVMINKHKLTFFCDFDVLDGSNALNERRITKTGKRTIQGKH